MKLKMLACCCSLLGVTAFAQKNEWKDPNVNEVNRAPMHTNYFAFETEDAALKGCKESSVNFMTLNGTWKFNWVKDADARPTDFYQVGFNDKGWANMPVPGIWELNGFGDPIYVNVGYAWRNQFRNNPPEVPVENNHVGSYRKEIVIPADWKGKEIFAHFGSVTSNMYLWVNGQYVGYSEDSKLEAEFNLTKYLKPGKNLIAFQTFRWCDGTYLEDQDFLRLCGVGRDCYLYTRNPKYIQDIRVTPDLDAQYKDATLNVSVNLKGSGVVDVKLLDKQGNSVATTTLKGSGRVSADIAVSNPLKWTAETPNLYTLVATLKEGNKELEVIPVKVGFRKIELKNSQILVNGQPVLFKGADRHEMDPDGGYVVSRERMLQDIKVMKEYNLNAVRTCHYPDANLWYDLCDEYGIYVVAEANVESHGMGYGEQTLAKNPAYAKAHMERNQRNVQRGFNHPSIIFWSLGNESGVGANNAARASWVKDYDPTRLVHFEAYMHNGGSRQYGYGIDFMKTNRPAVNPPEPPAVDVVSTMYPSVEGIIKLATQEGETRPVLMCEYAHAKGNALGNHQEYWNAVKKYPRLIGGYIWDWVDQSVIRKDSVTGKEYFSSLNGTNGLVFVDRKIKPAINECKKIYQHIRFDYSNGELTIRNEYNYLPLSAFRFSWKLMAGGELIKKGELTDIEAFPGTSARVKIDTGTSDSGQKGELILEINAYLKKDVIWAPKGFEIAWEQFTLQEGKVNPPVEEKTGNGGKLTVQKKANEIGIYNDRINIVFNKKAGLIQSWIVGGKEFLEKGPQINLWRAPTHNDGGYRPKTENEISRQWVEAGLDSLQHKLKSFKLVEEKNGTVSVATTFVAQKTGNKSYVEYTTKYIVDPSGKVQIDTDLKPFGNIISFPRIGYTMTVKSGNDTFSWYGYGPYDTYNDRHSGARLGRFSGTVDEQFTHHAYPQENGNKYRCSWVSLTDNEGIGLVAEGMPFIESSAMHYSLENLSEAIDESQLKRTDNVTWNIDYKTYPIGNRSCGPPPLEQYVLFAEPVSFSFSVYPVLNKKTVQ